MAGFELAYTLHGGDGHKLALPIQAASPVAAGVLCSIVAGEAKVAVTNDTALAGVCTGINKDGTAQVVVDPAAVYRVADASARLVGATLDIGTGAKTIAASTNADLVVTGLSGAGGPTLVKITTSNHAFEK